MGEAEMTHADMIKMEIQGSDILIAMRGILAKGRQQWTRTKSRKGSCRPRRPRSWTPRRQAGVRMRSFIVKMRVTELWSRLEAPMRQPKGQIAARYKDYAHCHTMDWEVCDVAPTDKADTM
jgi:hypothetical protein